MPKKPLYVVGNRVAIAAAYVTDEKVKLRSDNRRDMMVIVTSRHLHRALVFRRMRLAGGFLAMPKLSALRSITRSYERRLFRIVAGLKRSLQGSNASRPSEQSRGMCRFNGHCWSESPLCEGSFS